MTIKSITTIVFLLAVPLVAQETRPDSIELTLTDETGTTIWIRESTTWSNRSRQ